MFLCPAGKTTFIKNLFASYAQDPDLHVNDASAPTCRDLFINQPERLCTEIIVKDPSNQTAYHYLVQDTPGKHWLQSPRHLSSWLTGMKHGATA